MIAARFRQAFPVFLLALMVLLARSRPAPAGSATRLWVTDVTPRSFSLVWTANQAATCFANVYADPEGNQLIQGLTITLESASYPPAEENGVMKVSISGLAPDTTYYFEIVIANSDETYTSEMQEVTTGPIDNGMPNLDIQTPNESGTCAYEPSAHPRLKKGSGTPRTTPFPRSGIPPILRGCSPCRRDEGLRSNQTQGFLPASCR